jgi:hypothetical protein
VSESSTVESDAGGAAASISATVPCGAHRKNWDALENDYTQADRYEQALTLAIIGELCRPCPALAECATWARLDKYTGLAAGTWFRAGRRARPGRGGSGL